MSVLQVDIVVPVRNEERDLAPSIRRLTGYLRESFPFTTRITIADNGSTDATWAIADRLARELPEVRAIHLELPGRGRALRAIWSQGQAEVLAYMDVDLSTDLNALLPLVAPLLSGHSDLAIGTRLARGSRVIRGPKRELISRGYNLLLRTLMGARFSDAQCGFKAIRRDQARALLPLTRDTGWFFDTELLVLAERAGLRIHEIPVDWIDDLDSRVDIIATALADLRGMARLGAGLARGTIAVPRLRGPVLAGGRPAAGLPLQVARFTVIGPGRDGPGRDGLGRARDRLLRGPGQPELRRRTRLLGHRGLGGGPLHEADRGRPDRLRPHQAAVVAGWFPGRARTRSWTVTRAIRGVTVHDPGCRPGTSFGTQTAGANAYVRSLRDLAGPVGREAGGVAVCNQWLRIFNMVRLR